MDIEKIAQDRYRLRSHDNIMTVDAQDLRDLEAFATLHMAELEAEAKQAEAVKRYNQEMDARTHIVAENREKPWLPGEEQNEMMPAPSWREIEATAEHERQEQMQEHLSRIGVQLRVAHFTGDNSYPTEYSLTYGPVTVTEPTFDLALAAFIERLLKQVPMERYT